MNKSTSTTVALLAGLGVLSACGHLTGMSNTSSMAGAGKDMAMVEASQSQSVVTLKDVLDADTNDIPTLTAIGYAVTSSQPGRSQAQNA